MPLYFLDPQAQACALVGTIIGQKAADTGFAVAPMNGACIRGFGRQSVRSHETEGNLFRAIAVFRLGGGDQQHGDVVTAAIIQRRLDQLVDLGLLIGLL